MANFEDRLVSFVAYFLLCCITLFQNDEAVMFCVANVALKKPTDQGPGTEIGHKGYKAVDGIETDNWHGCTQTTKAKVTWWMVDLLAVYKIHSLAVLNTDRYGGLLQNFTVDIFMTDPRELPGFPDISGEICAYHKSSVPDSQWAELNCTSASSIGRFVRVIKRGFYHLALCEVRMKKRLFLKNVHSKLQQLDLDHYLRQNQLES